MTLGFGNQYSIQLSYGRELRIIPGAPLERPTSGPSTTSRGYNAEFGRCSAFAPGFSLSPSTMTEHDPHSSPIQTPKQLIVVVALAFLVPITVIGLLSQLFTSTARDAREDEQRVLERIKPVGTVVVSEAPPPAAAAAPATPAPAAAAVAPVAMPPPVAAAPAAAAATATASGGGEGKSVYDQTCHVCHATGLAGSPKFGDKAAWAPRIATGNDALYKAAINGLNAMPPKGGNAALSDAQVKAAVDYMVSAAK